MTQKRLVRLACRDVGLGVGVAAGTYAVYAGATWLRYGRVEPSIGDDRDPLLDRFMPAYEVVERHHVRVAAPADVAFAAACNVDLQRSALVRAIFKGRELMLGSDPDASARPRGLLAWTKSLGWGVLGEIPGREVVLGAVTQPWKADVLFRSLGPDHFTKSGEAGYVKIVWTLRADPIGPNESVVRTETRVMTTDPLAREKVRRYWSIFSPGIVLIRRAALRLVKVEAERHVREEMPISAERFHLVSTGDLDPQC